MRINLLVASCTLYLASSCLASSWARADTERNRSDNDHAPSYSYFEASYLEYDLDIEGIDNEPDGEKLKLSVELGHSLFAVVDRSTVEGEFAGTDYEFETEGYGFGLHGDFWYASYTYNTWEFDEFEFDVDTVRLGFRDDLTDHLEFNASYSWNDIEDADNDDGFQVGLAFKITDNFRIVADYETIGGDLDIDAFSAGIRIEF